MCSSHYSGIIIAMSGPNVAKQALDAIDRRDGEAIEGLRDKMNPGVAREIYATWRASLPWNAKDLYVALLMDQRDAGIEVVMRDALASPSVESRAYAICYLSGAFSQFESFLAAGGWVDPAKVDAAIAKWRNDVGEAPEAACPKCGGPIRSSDLQCKHCRFQLRAAEEDPGVFQAEGRRFEIRVGVPVDQARGELLRVAHAVKRGEMAMTFRAIDAPVAVPGPLRVEIARVGDGGRVVISSSRAVEPPKGAPLFMTWTLSEAADYELLVIRQQSDQMLARAAFRVVL